MSTIAANNRSKARRKAEAPSAAQQRQARQRSYNWRRRLMFLRRFLLTCVLAAMAWGGWVIWQQGHAERIGMVADTLLVEMPTIPTLRVSRVDIVGNDNLPDPFVAGLTRDLTGMPILQVPLDQVRDDLLAQGWVEQVSILRSLPGTIRINITERTPFAIWQHDGALRLIDHSGAEIMRDDVQAYAALPLIVGDGAPGHARALMTALQQQPALWQRVQAMVRVGDRRWDVRFDNGVEVMLPEQGIAEAWERLVLLDRHHAILSRDISMLDLRLADRLTVRPSMPRDVVKTSSAQQI